MDKNGKFRTICTVLFFKTMTPSPLQIHVVLCVFYEHGAKIWMEQYAVPGYYYDLRREYILEKMNIIKNY